MDTTEMIDPVTGEIIDEQQLAEQLLKQAKEQGVDVLGPDGLLNGLTKRVLETALDAEMTEHLGRDKHQPAEGGNIRNGTRSKTVLTEVGPVERDILGIWAGDGGEGAKFWLGVMTEIKNRGAEDVCIVVCDGLKGLPESINTAWPLATVQTCIIHLIRNTFRFASRHYWEEMGKDLRPVYTASTEAAAAERFREFDAKWGQRYPAITKLWQNAWAEFVPFLDWDVEIRRVICSTSAIESLNARYRRAVRARGHFPNGAAALKCLYLVTRSLDPTGRGRARWATRWKPALNAFAIAFEGRINS